MDLLPDLDELVVLRGAARDLEMRIRQPAASQLQGAHRSAHRGRGLEFDEVRVYVAGDDARTIDWRVTARRGRPHTKLFREERERQVWLLADLHPGLYFGSRRQLKSALLLRAAAWFAWVAVDSGDRLGAVITRGSSSPEVLPPRSRDLGALTLLQALVQNQPRAPGLSEPGRLGKALTTLRPLLRPGSAVVVLSDFSDLDAAAETALVALSMRAECRLVWLTDPLERDGLPSGSYRVGLPGRLWSLDGATSRDAWSATWAQREQRVSSISRSRRLPLLRLDTSDDLAQQMPAFIAESR
ncbi:MAG: DUF58 domain-containing protein [Burkholderiaceae bacterium]|nr:DUF58 domain-containing protein [Burkholderiaceae bacterium]